MHKAEETPSSEEFLRAYMKERQSILQLDFKEGQGWWVSKHMNPFDLADAYRMSGDFLIEKSKKEEIEAIILWPVVFLYRHAAELYLKKALTYIGLHEKGHDILKLYCTLEKNISALADKFKNRKILSLIPGQDVFFSIMEFHSISPRSTELRYQDSSLIGGEPHPLFLNFDYAQTHILKIQQYAVDLHQKLQKIGFQEPPYPPYAERK